MTVAVFHGETREFALARHREVRPDHSGRLLRFEYRIEKRCADARWDADERT